MSVFVDENVCVYCMYTAIWRPPNRTLYGGQSYTTGAIGNHDDDDDDDDVCVYSIFVYSTTVNHTSEQAWNTLVW